MSGISGLGDALSRFNKSTEPGESRAEGSSEKGKSSSHGHAYHVHVHKDGSHHLTVHKHGQLVHHSEHGSMQEATQAMNQHGGGGEAEAPGADSFGE